MDFQLRFLCTILHFHRAGATAYFGKVLEFAKGVGAGATGHFAAPLSLTSARLKRLLA